jgi:hypothetical protein
MARLRLFFALLLINLGTWFAALAISGYYEPGVRMHSEPAAAPVGPSTSPDASQFISLVTRERFVAVETAAAATPTKLKAAKLKAAKPAANTKSVADKRRQQPAAVWLPWPLNLLNKSRG